MQQLFAAKRKLVPAKLRLALLALLPLVLLALPAGFFDGGQSLCLSKLLLDVECYACGMTRAMQHLIHFDFEAAFAYNALSFVVFPFLVLLYYKWVKKAVLESGVYKKA